MNAVIADNASSVLTLVKSHGNTSDSSTAARTTPTPAAPTSLMVKSPPATPPTEPIWEQARRSWTTPSCLSATLAPLRTPPATTTPPSTAGRSTSPPGPTVPTPLPTPSISLQAASSSNGGSASGQGLASLTRGTNITLAAGAIIGHDYALTAALNLTTGTIQNLGTSADLYYGIAMPTRTVPLARSTSAAARRFKGISSV